MAVDTTFKQGDSLWSLAKKILQRLNSYSNVPSTPYTQFQVGDSLYILKRKILLRLNELLPTATGDVTFKQDDSSWSLERKILAVLNQASTLS